MISRPSSIRPSRLFYILPFIIILVGLLTVGRQLTRFTLASPFDPDTRIPVPGEKIIMLSQNGPYVIYKEQTRSSMETYRNVEKPEFRCTITDRASKNVIPIESTGKMHSSYSDFENGIFGSSLWLFNAPSSGLYRFNVELVDETDAQPDFVLTVRHDSPIIKNNMKTIMIGQLILLGSITLGAATWGIIFFLRRPKEPD